MISVTYSQFIINIYMNFLRSTQAYHSRHGRKLFAQRRTYKRPTTRAGLYLRQRSRSLRVEGSRSSLPRRRLSRHRRRSLVWQFWSIEATTSGPHSARFRFGGQLSEHQTRRYLSGSTTFLRDTKTEPSPSRHATVRS